MILKALFLKNLSDFKFGIKIPSRGNSSDLLNMEDEKNDYDWLLTPPETPLFRTLDDNDPQPVNPVSRGRLRSQAIPISRSLTDKNYRTSRTSYSPQRLSLSPQSSGSSAQMKGISSSAPQSSPPPAIRSTTPTQRSRTPPNKPSRPASWSSTPTLQMVHTSSRIQAPSYGRKGASPVKARRGNYASPKSQGWQTTLSGFNSEASPNLPSSLSDRSVSNLRGSSPASRNGREFSMKIGGKWMSPTSSRSISSSHSEERDHFSSYSKGSMAYSGDDDEEFLHSITVGISRCNLPRKDGVLTNNKAMSFSRKPSRALPSNSVPKRSFNSSLRLVDQRKTPQSMFRPLLSSVPATTFRPPFSRNSSFTTSSNTNRSSEQGVFSVAPDVEGSDREQNGMPDRWERAEDFDSHEEVFLFDKADQIIRDANGEALCGKHSGYDKEFSENLKKKHNSEDIQNPMRSIGDVTNSIDSFVLAQCAENQGDSDGYLIKAVCSKCGKELDIEDISRNKKICEECGENRFRTAEIASTSVRFTVNEVQSQMDTVMEELSKGEQLNSRVVEFHKDDNRGVMLDKHGMNINLGDNLFQNILSMEFLDQKESQLSDQHLDINRNTNVAEDCRGSTRQSSNHDVNPSLKVDAPESAGISVVLLQGSAGTKRPILQRKSLSLTNIFCSEPSYSRNNVDPSRRSFGLDSSSATSSIDLGLSIQTEAYVQYLSSRKSEALSIERNIESLVQSVSSDCDASSNYYEPRHLGNKFDEKTSCSTECLRYDSLREMKVVPEECANSLDLSNLDSTPSSRPVNSEDCRSVHADSCRTVSSSESRSLNHQQNNDLPCSSVVDFMCAKECTSSLNSDEDHQNSGNNVEAIKKTSDISVFSEMEEHRILPNHTFENVIFDAATNNCSIGTAESNDGHIELGDGKTECMPFREPPSPGLSNEHTIPQKSENEVSLCSSEFVTAVLETGESAIMVEGPKNNQSRNLTLEEATDTILFCSSIIHDLAYKATTIAMEKDQKAILEQYSPPPTVKIMEKPIPGLREGSRNLSDKRRTQASRKLERKKTEARSELPLRELKNENHADSEEFAASNDEIPKKVDSARPPKLESKCNCSVM
ncbi:uncharacterized protein LOC110018813 isoform X2 [Phalaenopsis equestris]|uniref:uncharacterized protein LOC110018813 isoform X2 n=1 Tax=Phalaenopsis equestris TaxID=78828 RepID=UPI0009E1B791|nr:uncharacterized protein LOC110018813 isoform X2 [Phalaenopsis equestris]